MPNFEKLRMLQFLTIKVLPEVTEMPFRPVKAAPSMSRPLNVTTSLAPAATAMPFVPETTTPPLLTESQKIVIALVIVTAPKPPGSRQSISPLGAVFEIAPAKVLHGAVRLHGLASSPTPETQVRVAWAWAGADARNGAKSPMAKASRAMRRI